MLCLGNGGGDVGECMAVLHLCQGCPELVGGAESVAAEGCCDCAMSGCMAHLLNIAIKSLSETFTEESG